MRLKIGRLHRSNSDFRRYRWNTNNSVSGQESNLTHISIIRTDRPVTSRGKSENQWRSYPLPLSLKFEWRKSSSFKWKMHSIIGFNSCHGNTRSSETFWKYCKHRTGFMTSFAYRKMRSLMTNSVPPAIDQSESIFAKSRKYLNKWVSHRATQRK